MTPHFKVGTDYFGLFERIEPARGMNELRNEFSNLLREASNIKNSMTHDNTNELLIKDYSDIVDKIQINIFKREYIIEILKKEVI